MRPCQFIKSEYVENENDSCTDASGEKKFRKNKRVERVIAGKFHAWGQDCSLDLNENGTWTVALVETKDGHVHKVEPQHLQFTDVPGAK
jgi:hypothetical protein